MVVVFPNELLLEKDRPLLQRVQNLVNNSKRLLVITGKPTFVLKDVDYVVIDVLHAMDRVFR